MGYETHQNFELSKKLSYGIILNNGGHYLHIIGRYVCNFTLFTHHSKDGLNRGIGCTRELHVIANPNHWCGRLCWLALHNMVTAAKHANPSRVH